MNEKNKVKFSEYYLKVDYNQVGQLQLKGAELSSAWIKGHFGWEESIKEALLNATTDFRETEEYWYLDEEGNRLEEALLFEKSPWSIVGTETPQKLVQRYMNFEIGEAWFCDRP